MRRNLIPLLLVALLAPFAFPEATSATASPAATAQILVGFGKGAGSARQQALITRVDGFRLRTIATLRTAVVSVPAAEKKEALALLNNLPGVAYAEIDRTRRASALDVNDPFLDEADWQLANPRFPDAWELTTGDPNVVVAVLDTGVAPNHPDLGALVPGWNFVDLDSDTSDDDGHGTFVAGIVAGQGNNSIGVAGVCWQCRIMPVKVITGTGGSDSAIASGIVWATDHGADVINMSLAGPGDSITLDNALSYAEEHGVVLVAAAGNDNTDEPYYPAAYPGVISVGAVNAFDHFESFSNYGDWVEVDAPGCTWSTVPESIYRPYVFYEYGCGTSFAAPYVSGLAALARSYNRSASAASIRDAIEQWTVPLAYGDGNSVHGRIDALATLQAIKSAAAGPQASFTPSVLKGTAPLSVRFSNSSKNATSYVWSFDDSSGSTDVSPLHTFERAGTYNVTLTATAGTNSSQANAVIQVDSLPPTASFAVSSASGSAPLTVRFSNGSLRATSYIWSFDDGTPLSIETAPSHTFRAPGRFDVTLTATGPGGSSSTNASILVEGSKPDLAVKVARTASRLSSSWRVDSLVATLRNKGGGADRGVRLRATVPVGSSLTRASARGATCTISARRAICYFGTLAAGKTVKVSLTARLARGARVTLRASGAKVETTLLNNTASIRRR
jgi:subtilisin family serine protease